MDGLLVIDKPSGLTSHDIVARARRVLRERRIGHTGTLDPMASGVLPLVVGRATRLARFLSAGDKRYDATVRLGVSTDTRDATGTAVGPRFEGPWPKREAIDAALTAFRGTFLQQPPAFSAKKIGGQRSYVLARQAQRAGADEEDAALAVDLRQPEPVTVTAHRIDLLEADGPVIRLDVLCSAGFYVRSLAHDLGTALGTGAHLAALRRTMSAGVTLDAAHALAAIEAGGAETARAALVPMDAMLAGMTAVHLTTEAVKRVACGRDVGPADAVGGTASDWPVAPWVRLLDPAGHLVAVAEPAAAPGLLHPAVVLM